MTTYKIIRFYLRDDIENEVIETGLTLEEAQVRCKDPETSSRTCKQRAGVLLTRACGAWFDGYTEE